MYELLVPARLGEPDLGTPELEQGELNFLRTHT